MNSHSHYRTGVTLIEVAISTVLVGVVLVASLETVGSALRTARSGEDIANGQALAENLLAEVMAMPFEDVDGTPLFGIEADENNSPSSRSEFDDLDDYDGWSEGPPQLKNGAVVGSLVGWTRSVSVNEITDNASDSFGLREAVVTVTNFYGITYQLSALRSEHSAQDQSPMIDRTVATGVMGVLSFSDGTFVYRTTPNDNQAFQP